MALEKLALSADVPATRILQLGWRFATVMVATHGVQLATEVVQVLFDGDVGHKREEASEGEAEGGHQGHQQHGQAQLTWLGDGWKHHYGVPGMKPECMLKIQNPNMRKT